MLNREVGRKESARVMNVSPRGLKAFWHSLDKRVSERAREKSSLSVEQGFMLGAIQLLQRRDLCKYPGSFFASARCRGACFELRSDPQAARPPTDRKDQTPIV